MSQPIFLNMEVLISFLKRYADGIDSLFACAQDVIKAAQEGKSHYELDSSESRSGKTEVIYFEYKDNKIIFKEVNNKVKRKRIMIELVDAEIDAWDFVAREYSKVTGKDLKTNKDILKYLLTAFRTTHLK